MADRLLRPAVAGIAALALLGVATAGSARTHHAATTAHTVPGRHPATKHGASGKRGSRHERKPVERHDATPAGVTSVPAGGLKVYCPARRNPLLIRKATQGAGTTVTIVCR